MSERRLIVPASPSLLPDASRVIERAFAGTRYLDGVLEVLRSALVAPSADARALASMRDDRVDGVIVFGSFGGASGAGRLHVAAVEREARRTGVGVALVRESLTALRGEGARFVLAELPDDRGALPGARDFLDACGFSEESRVDDFYRDGIALAFMRLELGGQS